MNKIQELMEKRKQAWEGTKAFVEAKKDSDGLMSDEDAKTYAEMEKKVTNFTKEIERMQSMEAVEHEMAKPMTEPLTSQPMTTENQAKKKKTGRASNEYKEGLLEELRSNFRQVSNVLSEGVDTAGGYLVPEEYDKRLIDDLTKENIMRTLGTTMSTKNLNIRTDKDVKVAAEAIFSELGLNMTTAINMFLRQTIRDNGIPFELKLKPNATTVAAIKEGRAIAIDPSVQGYTNMDDLKVALDV